MILRGEHLEVVMTEFGLVPVVGVHAKENPDGKKGRQAKTYSPRSWTSTPSPLFCRTEHQHRPLGLR